MTAPSVPLAWRQARAGRTTTSRTTPALILLVAFLGRHLPSWRKARTSVMQTAAFGFLCYAAWQHSVIAGCVAIGVSLLILEALMTPKGTR